MPEKQNIETTIVEKPKRPLDNECCGGGACQPCVWDHYSDLLRRWQQQVEKSPSSEQSSDN